MFKKKKAIVELGISKKDYKKRVKEEKRNKRREKRVKYKDKLEKYKYKINVLYKSIKVKIRKSLKLELLTAVVICFITATIVGSVVFNACHVFDIGINYYMDYTDSKYEEESILINNSQEIVRIDNSSLNFENIDYIIECVNRKVEEDSDDRNESDNEEYNEIHEAIKSALNNLKLGDGYYLYNYNIRDEGITHNEVVALEKSLIDLQNENKLNYKSVEDTLYNFVTSKISLKDLKLLIMKDTLNRLNGIAYLIDSEGNIIYKNSPDFIEKINIKDAMDKSLGGNREEEEFFKVYPTVIEGEVHYILNDTELYGRRKGYYTATIWSLTLISSVIAFILLLFKLINGKLKYIEYISGSLREISKGNLDYKVEVNGSDELARVAEDINFMESELKSNIEKENAAQKTKNELITNVSHDLRTPLTLIIGYLGLVKNKNFKNEEEMQNYIEIAYGRSEKLKELIDDLFEYTKLSNNGMELQKSNISINNLLIQLTDEMMSMASENDMNIDVDLPKERIEVNCDVKKITRVFENLIGNAIKYNESKESICVSLSKAEETVKISVSNKASSIKEEELQKLFDRFYRAEESRNSATGGSGLGLAICKTIVDLHEGRIWAELEDERIVFNVELKA